MACHPLHIPVRVVAVKRSDVRFGDGVANAVANVALATVSLVQIVERRHGGAVDGSGEGALAMLGEVLSIDLVVGDPSLL